MRDDREIAFKMRRAGKSYAEIKAELSIPKATLSGWFSTVDWSGDIRKRLIKAARTNNVARIVELNRLRGLNLKRAYEDARKEARRELSVYKYNPAFIAGIMLYWGEGGKNPRDGVKFSNTDPEMVRLYVFFLSRVCQIPMKKIKANVLIYPDLEEEGCRLYWSREIGVPLQNFTKSVLIQGRHKTRRLDRGVCMVTVSNLYFKEKMLEWIRILPQELMNREYYANITGAPGEITDADMV